MDTTNMYRSRSRAWLARPLFALALGALAACSRQEVEHDVDRTEHDVDNAVQKVREKLPPATEVKAKLKQVNAKIQEEGNDLLDDVRAARDAHEQRKRERERIKAGD